MTGRGKKAAAKKDAVVPEVETPEAQAPLVAEAVEVSEASEVKKGRGKAKAILEEAPVAEIKEMKGRGKKAQPPAKKKQKDKMVSEPEVAEKKDHDKKAHPSADSASQVASEVDNPDKINLTGMAGTSGGRTLQNAFKEIDTIAAEMKLQGNVDRW